MLTILRVRGASCQDIDDQREVAFYLTPCVRKCPWLTSNAARDNERCNWRLQLDVLPSSLLSAFTYAVLVVMHTAHCVWARYINNDQFATKAHSHGSVRLLWHTGCLSDNCSPAYRFTRPKHQRNSWGAAPARTSGWC